MEWECAGINHLAWFTKLRHQGKDLYPTLKKLARADLSRARKEGPDHPNVYLEEKPEWHYDLVRKDMMLQFGAFITESSGHLSEYLHYYRKGQEFIDEYCRQDYDGGSNFYATEWPSWREKQDTSKKEMASGKIALMNDRSWEYGSWIIEAREKNVPFRVHGNVMNSSSVGGDKLISNLPDDGCVEVACMIDRNGIQPTRYGALPRQMAAICRSNMNVFDLGAQAAIEKSKEMAIHALMLDPLTSAVCSPAQIRKMTLELFKAEADFLPGYK